MTKLFKSIYFSPGVPWQQQGHHWVVIWATGSPLATSLSFSWWFGNGRWCSVKLPVNFTSDHSFAILMCVFLFLPVCVDITTLFKLKCPVQLRAQLPGMDSLKPNRKDAQIQKKCLCTVEIYCFSLIPFCHTLPRKVSRSTAQKVSQLDFSALRHTAHGAVSPLHSQLPQVAPGLSKWTW